MMETKFRAWDNINKEWYTPKFNAAAGELHELLVSFRGDLIAHTLNGLVHESTFANRYTLVRYTGLKDKNGKEIYEGDVVDVCIFWCSPENPDNDKHYRGIISITPEGVMFEIKKHLNYLTSLEKKIEDINWYHFPFLSSKEDEFAEHHLLSFMGASGNRGEYNEEDIEIISNIYENPELLNK